MGYLTGNTPDHADLLTDGESGYHTYRVTAPPFASRLNSIIKAVRYMILSTRLQLGVDQWLPAGTAAKQQYYLIAPSQL